MDGLGEMTEGAGGGASMEPVFAFGRERRMHARAYDYWVSLLDGRPLPLVADLDPTYLGSFAANSVLIDLGEGNGSRVVFLGQALREEAALEQERPSLTDVPEGSLLSELLSRLPHIVAHRTPVGFEAEFIGRSGGRTLHRGILLPFADETGALSAIYGVINWKLMAAVEDAPDILSAVGNAFAQRPTLPAAPAWGDGPGAAAAAEARPPAQPLEQQLAAARTWAALAATDRTRGPQGTHAALGAAYDFLLAAQAERTSFAMLIAAMGLEAEPAPAVVVELVFGTDLPRPARLRYTGVLAHALRLGIGPAGLAGMLDRHEGGFGALAAAERRAQRVARRAAHADAARAQLAAAPALGSFTFGPVDDDFLLLIGHARATDRVDVVARVPFDHAMTELALARIAAAA